MRADVFALVVGLFAVSGCSKGDHSTSSSTSEAASSWAIMPRRGVGPVRLGMSQDEVTFRFPDAEIWELSPMTETEAAEREVRTDGLSMVFLREHGGLLGMIVVQHDGAKLAGETIIGISERALLDSDWGGMGAPARSDESDPTGTSYEWEQHDTYCWVADGIVQHVTLFPKYDYTNDRPVWPSRGR